MFSHKITCYRPLRTAVLRAEGKRSRTLFERMEKEKKWAEEEERVWLEKERKQPEDIKGIERHRNLIRPIKTAVLRAEGKRSRNVLEIMEEKNLAEGKRSRNVLERMEEKKWAEEEEEESVCLKKERKQVEDVKRIKRSDIRRNYSNTIRLMDNADFLYDYMNTLDSRSVIRKYLTIVS
jgi:hypothetical protein